MTTITNDALENAHSQARRRLAAVAEALDPGTFRHLADRGVAAGWRCLEVGAGAGSVAAWLCDRVGPTGQVVATDVHTRLLDGIEMPSLEVWRHDVGRDELPAATFDLIHVRLVLGRLPQRQRALERMAAALAPGGWLVAEDMDFASVLLVGDAEPAALFTKLVQGHHAVMTARGFDPFYGSLLARDLRSAGLCALGTEARAFLWPGGSAGATAWGLTFERLREALLDTELATERELSEVHTLLGDPGCALLSQMTVAAWARRPVA